MITINTKPLVSVRQTRDDLADQMYRQLKELIVTGVYRPGDKIPTVESWCEQLGLAPKTVHLAIRELGKEGLLQSNRAQGTIVCEPTRDAVKDIGHLYLSPIIERLLRLGLTKAEVQELAAIEITAWFTQRGGSDRRSVRTAEAMPLEDRRSPSGRRKSKTVPDSQ